MEHRHTEPKRAKCEICGTYEPRAGYRPSPGFTAVLRKCAGCQGLFCDECMTGDFCNAECQVETLDEAAWAIVVAEGPACECCGMRRGTVAAAAIEAGIRPEIAHCCEVEFLAVAA